MKISVRSVAKSRVRECVLLISALLFLTVFGCAQSIQSVTGILKGHEVGGVTIDLVGNIYVADFGDLVWKMTPEGELRDFATGFYGSSGNAIDHAGNLLQSNFYGDSVAKVDRKGQMTPFATSGLNRPVGIAIDRKTNNVFVANCGDNSIARIAGDGSVSTFAKSDLFKCPNGVAFDQAGNLYVVNFRDNRMLKVDLQGVVEPFATVSQKGLGHLCFKQDRFYVTAFESHEIYEVMLNGVVKRILGNGERGIVDGDDAKARLSFPNGIACDPWRPLLYINESVNDSTDSLPRQMIIRKIVLKADR